MCLCGESAVVCCGRKRYTMVLRIATPHRAIELDSSSERLVRGHQLGHYSTFCMILAGTHKNGAIGCGN